MNRIKEIVDKVQIETFLRRDPFLHIYGIGDLDDFFWPYTKWYGLECDGVIKSLFLYYWGVDTPTLLAFEDHNIEESKELLRGIISYLPDQFYCHIAPHLENDLREKFQLSDDGLYYKFKLVDSLPDVENSNCLETRFLEERYLDQINHLYSESYPGNWFDKRMLETAKYLGAFKEDKMLAIAGVHVYSEKYKIAVLGNIATTPVYRNQGIAKKLTNLLCQHLLETVDLIGLNVDSSNKAAIRCYQNVGFKIHSTYKEFVVKRI
jgi:ribosomal protein S18 acetylase RimI-like enzyme